MKTAVDLHISKGFYGIETLYALASHSTEGHQHYGRDFRHQPTTA